MFANSTRTIGAFIAVFFSSFIIVGCSQYKVYSVKDTPMVPVSGGVLYALPKTELCISLTVERRFIDDAPYSAFASEMVGVNNIDTNYRIVDISVVGNNIADPDHFYMVKVRKGALRVDERHLLLAIGGEAMQCKMDNVANNASVKMQMSSMAQQPTLAEYNLYDRIDSLYTRYDSPGRPSYISSKKDSRTQRQRATFAAERLEEVQEKMQQLLNGEYDGAYGAEAVKYIYEKLKEQEQSIVKSFCGETRRETIMIYLDPVLRRGECLIDTIAWFSASAGLAFSEELLPEDATPVVCTVQPANNLRKASRFVKYHTSGLTQNSAAGRSGTAAAKKRDGKNFRYRVPEQTTVSVSSETFTVSTQIPIMQLGPIMALPRNRVTAVFDQQTLDLIYFTRKIKL